MDKSVAIIGLLNGHLNTLATTESLVVKWEGQVSEPESGNYLRTWVLPTEPIAAWLGSGAPDKLRLIHQIDVVSHLGSWAVPAGIADKIGQHFKRPQRLTSTGVLIRLLHVAHRPGRREESRYVKTVDIITDVLAKTEE